MKRRLALAAFLLLWSDVGYGLDLYRSEDVSFTLQGYYKNLFFSSRRRATDEAFVADLNRLRTDWRVRIKDILTVRALWDNEVIGGGFVDTEEFAARETLRNDPVPDMEYEIVRRKGFFYGQNFYRATAEIDPGFFKLTLGRQKIDWGIMRLLSPADLFTPLSLFDVEKGEKVGVTAANLSLPIASFRFNPVFAFDPDWDKTRLGGRMTRTAGRFDLSLFGGKFLKDRVVGFDFSGDVQKMGLRGEFLFDATTLSPNFVQGALGVDYGFENSLTLALEYFFNGQGGTGLLPGGALRTTANQIKSMHRNFLSFLIKYDITPLWSVSLQQVTDMTGGSFFISPETRTSFFSWMELVAGADFPVGRTGGEFTAVPNIYHLQTQFFF